jgi:hypothetical protein
LEGENNMKKQLVIIGIVALLICVGLSGCTNNNDIVTITELKLHPDSYINKNITTIGKWINGYPGPLIRIYNESGEYILAHMPNSDTSTLVNETEYYWTGKILKQATDTIYLEVTKIKTT